MKNQQNRWLVPVLSIAACALLTSLACWYDLTYNGGRLVYPMESYSFRPADIPMLLALALDACCLVFLFAKAVFTQKKQVKETNRTRRLNPWLGLLGFLGFFGFIGFWSSGTLGDYTPFCFLTFFGFFGFFYEGKMSGTLMDERYRENAQRAQLSACRTGISIIFLLLVAAGQAGRAAPEHIAAFLLIGVSLALGLTLFLSEYLLYRYDRTDAAGED